MPTLLHRMVLKQLPGPFFGWLGTLMFLFLMQFLMRHLPDLVGKGLHFTVLAELVAYNLAYMVVLAVPMAVLMAVLMAFGRLADTRAYAVIQGAGVSLPRLMWPVAIAGLAVMGAMLYFNNIVLPEANFRARVLWNDIRRVKPAFALQPGVFYDDLNRYSILAQGVPPDSNVLRGVTLYDYSEGSRRQSVVQADYGTLEALPSGTAMDVTLYDGEVHRRIEPDRVDGAERYERLRFAEQRLRIPLDPDFMFERSDSEGGRRTDRTMRTSAMITLVDSLGALVDSARTALTRAALTPADPVALPEVGATLRAPEDTPFATAAEPFAPRAMLAGLTVQDQRATYDAAIQRLRTLRRTADDAERTIRFDAQRANRYRVEIHKKFSIATACLLFIFLGAPLGLRLARRGLGGIGAAATGIFLFFWVTLVQGEKLADRGFLEPWVGMWSANMLIGSIGVVFLASIVLQGRVWRR